MIEVKRIDDTTFEVTVKSKSETRHQVTVKDADYQRLTRGRISAEALVEKSFEFLLEREPNTAILPTFDLMLIKQYFPEFENEIQS